MALHRRHRGSLPRALRIALHAAATVLGWKLHDLDCERRLLNSTIAFLNSLSPETGIPEHVNRHLRTEAFRRSLDTVERARLAGAREKEVTLQGVGSLMGRSRERARQIAAQTMRHLRPKVKHLR